MGLALLHEDKNSVHTVSKIASFIHTDSSVTACFISIGFAWLDKEYLTEVASLLLVMNGATSNSSPHTVSCQMKGNNQTIEDVSQLPDINLYYL